MSSIIFRAETFKNSTRNQPKQLMKSSNFLIKNIWQILSCGMVYCFHTVGQHVIHKVCLFLCVLKEDICLNCCLVHCLILREITCIPSGFHFIKIKDESMISKPSIYSGKEIAELSCFLCRKALKPLLQFYTPQILHHRRSSNCSSQM